MQYRMGSCYSPCYEGRVKKKHADNWTPREAARLAEYMDRIATSVLELRVRRGWTQIEAAERCSMGLREYRRVEKSESPASLTTIVRLCEGLNVDAVQLLRPIKTK